MGKLSKTGEKGEKFEIEGSSDKAERTAIHKAVKALFKNLETKTVGDKIEVWFNRNWKDLMVKNFTVKLLFLGFSTKKSAER